ncbi:MAG: glutathione S-transferase family protein [Rhizobacter sp.]|nr:glutathione S-transferase family protein [Rhizobacter sp.]
MLTIHHLGKSQSERIIWLCEELGVPYELKHYVRDAITNLSPPELMELHPLGAAPVLTEGDLVLAESGAITDYIIARHGGGRLALAPAHPDFAQYLYWLHFANGNLQPNMGRNMLLRRLVLPPDNAVLVATRGRLDRALALIDARLAGAPFLAGAEFTAADIMTVFSLTTMRYFMPVDLRPWAHITAYLGRIGERDAYRAAMRKGDPGMALLLD